MPVLQFAQIAQLVHIKTAMHKLVAKTVVLVNTKTVMHKQVLILAKPVKWVNLVLLVNQIVHPLVQKVPMLQERQLAILVVLVNIRTVMHKLVSHRAKLAE